MKASRFWPSRRWTKPPRPKRSSASSSSSSRCRIVIDPIVSLRPGGPNARTDGNVWLRQPDDNGANPSAPARRRRVKWTAEDFAAAGEGQLPLGKPTDEWKYGDLDAGFKQRGARARRDLRRAATPAIRPLETRTRDGLLAERQALHALLDAEHGADGQRGRAGGSASIRPTSSSSANTPAAASAARDRRRRSMVDPGAALEEGQRAGDDAHHARRGALHRAARGRRCIGA